MRRMSRIVAFCSPADPVNNTVNSLIIETSTEIGSVAVARGDVVVAELSFASRDAATGARAESLAPTVEHCLQLASITARDVSEVICGAGPGGFTSLRSAAALAKGLCSALTIPLYGVSSLEMLAWSAVLSDGDYVALIPAARGELFAHAFRRAGGGTSMLRDAYLTSDDVARPHVSESGISQEARGAVTERMKFVAVPPRAASAAGHLAEVRARGAVDLDSWEPVYGRLAEAQVKWEAAHGRALPV